MAVIEIDHLTKDYGSGRGVFDVSFQVDKGNCYGFLGPNGAGKSTTIRHLMGFSHPDSGECRINGKESFSYYGQTLKEVGYISGEIALPVGLNGREFIKMIGEMSGRGSQEELNELLTYFALDEASLEIQTKRLSLGLKRKLAIVAAFLGNPAVLILDEPTSGLDPLMQEKFIALVKKKKEEGETILLSSHIFSEVDATCDQIGIIKDGHLISQFEADSLRHNNTKTYRIHFATPDEYARFSKENVAISCGAILERHDYSSVILLSATDEKVNELISLLSNYQIVSFSSKRESLQDYFMKFYREEQNFGGAL